ncbi:MAG: c-type cytochrome [Chloroflexi bacterium]|uniref:C-type cytochrome n=1 Tax=Candidatus Chlorohelix allophototropha TaxID=3003348 RepID=A0A8T7M5U3_9CHLR|nr:c-type cytochrome [Chloroflexota bacterium]WJW69345.1 cytochrome c [Chloroflexota bacterium L227-S17]
MKLTKLVSLLVLVAVMLAACSEDALTNPTAGPDIVKAFKAEPLTNNGKATNGELVFYRLPCLSCHLLNGSGGLEGRAPALDKIGTTGATRVEGVTAVQYLRHAILKPEDLRLPDLRNIMPSFANTLSPSELEDLVAYLLTLK